MVVVIGCPNSEKLAKKLGRVTGMGYEKPEIVSFPDGEKKLVIKRNLKSNVVIIVQTGLPDPNNSLMEVCQAANIAKHFEASEIVAVFTYLPYSSQDKYNFKNDIEKYQPKTLKIAAKMLKSIGVDTLVMLDAHFADKFGKFTQHKLDMINVPVGKLLVEHVKKTKRLKYADLLLVAPDAGALPRVQQIVDEFKKENIEIEMANLIKRRIDAYTVVIEGIEGADPRGKNALIVDDMICTGGTLVKSVEWLKEHGAVKAFTAATHGIFATEKDGLNSPKIITRMKDGTDYCVVTDSLDTPFSEVPVFPAVLEGIRSALK